MGRTKGSKNKSKEKVEEQVAVQPEPKAKIVIQLKTDVHDLNSQVVAFDKARK